MSGRISFGQILNLTLLLGRPLHTLSGMLLGRPSSLFRW